MRFTPFAPFPIAGASPGPVRTVFGALGKPTLLDVTPDLQQLTTRFEKVVWKRDTSDPVTKSIILDYSGGNSSIKLNQSMRFHPTNFSLEILETSRQDAEMYTFTGTQQYEEKEVHLRLEVYGNECSASGTSSAPWLGGGSAHDLPY